MRCAAHRLAFTVYPPGHVPYGPVPLVELAPDGGDATGESETLFDAAAEAAHEEPRLWPRQEAPDPGATRSTQARRVARGALLLGLAAPRTSVELAAAVSQLPRGALVEARERVASTAGLIARSREVAKTFTALSERAKRALMDRLAVLGHLAGCWGPPYRWVPRTGRLLALGSAFWQRGGAGRAARRQGSSASGGTHDFAAREPP